MIIWINGAFGAGKTQTAYELNRRIADSFVYDPENAGFYIRENLPKNLKVGDFQNFPMWREINYSMLKYIKDKYDGIVIVPMTICNEEYFNEIVVKLRNNGVVVKHFVLSASKETILRRLKSRGEGKNSWAAQQAERCIEGFNNSIFQEHIDTNNLSVDDVVNKIAELSGISLLPDGRSKVRKRVDCILTQIKNIR